MNAPATVAPKEEIPSAAQLDADRAAALGEVEKHLAREEAAFKAHIEGIRNESDRRRKAIEAAHDAEMRKRRAAFGLDAVTAFRKHCREFTVQPSRVGAAAFSETFREFNARALRELGEKCSVRHITHAFACEAIEKYPAALVWFAREATFYYNSHDAGHNGGAALLEAEKRLSRELTINEPARIVGPLEKLELAVSGIAVLKPPGESLDEFARRRWDAVLRMDRAELEAIKADEAAERAKRAKAVTDAACRAAQLHQAQLRKRWWKRPYQDVNGKFHREDTANK